MGTVRNEKSYQGIQAEQWERVDARPYIRMATGQRGVLARIRIMDSTYTLYYFMLSEVKWRGQAERLDIVGLIIRDNVVCSNS